MSVRRFATHGSDEFNQRMEAQVEEIGKALSAALGDQLVALVLGGGYARGEGGVVINDGVEHPYNDLDFLLIVRSKRGDFANAVSAVSAEYTKRIGIDVDFSRPLTIDDIRAWPHWLMWTDVYLEHRVIVGPEDIISANAPSYLRDSPPLIEATRLLLNRGAGLLWALRITEGLEQPHDPDFVRRNLHKCEIAIGDALILAHGRHVAPYGQRLVVLQELAKQDENSRRFVDPTAYEAALNFRLRPDASAAEQPTTEQLETLAKRWSMAFLFIESQRTGMRFNNVDEYAQWSGLREPELHTPQHLVKNLVRNARLRRFSHRYPRERLYRALPGMLTGARGGTWNSESQRFLGDWGRCN